MAEPPTTWTDCDTPRKGCECRTCSPERYPTLFDLPPDNVTPIRKAANAR